MLIPVISAIIVKIKNGAFEYKVKGISFGKRRMSG